MFKVSKVTRERCRFGVFIVNFEYISHFFGISIVRCVFSLIISLPVLLLLITSNQSILNMAQNINNGFGRNVKIPLFFKIG